MEIHRQEISCNNRRWDKPTHSFAYCIVNGVGIAAKGTPTATPTLILLTTISNYFHFQGLQRQNSLVHKPECYILFCYAFLQSCRWIDNSWEHLHCCEVSLSAPTHILNYKHSWVVRPNLHMLQMHYFYLESTFILWLQSKHTFTV